jgi:hypothetical protein
VTAPKNDKFKDYARYAEHCLNIVATTTDRESRSIQREMAAEWLRLADEMQRPRSESKCKWDDARHSATEPGRIAANIAKPPELLGAEPKADANPLDS